jgi:hypothetical protein
MRLEAECGHRCRASCQPTLPLCTLAPAGPQPSALQGSPLQACISAPSQAADQSGHRRRPRVGVQGSLGQRRAAQYKFVCRRLLTQAPRPALDAPHP